VFEGDKGQGIGVMRLATPATFRRLQRTLYVTAKWAPVVRVGRGVKPVGEPDAGNPHVRFDERRRETE
jgi:hypothetical protein